MLQRQHASADFQLLPAIDLRGGHVVRLAEGDFARETVYGADPAEVAASFAATGTRWLHVVDLDGAKDGARRQSETVARVIAAAGERVRCEVAGGLRTKSAVSAVLDAGAARAVVGTAALDDPAFVGRLVRTFGDARVAVALDVRDGVAVGQGWVAGAVGVPAEAALERLADQGARTFIVTAIARDGLLGGPDLELLGRMVALGRGEIIASAGIATLEDISATRAAGCSGAIVGRAIYEGRLDLAAAVQLVERR